MNSSTPRDTAAFLWDVRRACELISEFVRGKSFDDYTDDVLLRSAVERQFQIVGEALNRLSRVDPDLASRIPDLARIVAFRNILVHGYATVNHAVVWRAATVQVVELRAVVDRHLDS